MKILHIDTEKSWRGGEQQVLYLLKGLRERGHHSTLLSQPASPLAERAKGEGIDVREVQMHGGVDPLAILRISAHFRSGYDICHMHTANAHSLGFYASLLARGPRLVASRRVSFPVRGAIKRIKYKGVDKVIAVSGEIGDGLVESGIEGQRVTVIHSAIDLGRFGRYEGEPGRPVVGVFAHLAEHKGHRFFFDAAREISRQFPEVTFMIVGDGEERKSLEEYARTLGIAGRVLFKGFSSEVPLLLQECTITVLPSVSGEGSPGVLKESMAAGVPVVTTDVGGSAEVVEDERSGIVVPPADAAALADAMARLLGDAVLRERLRQGGLERAREFSAERMVERTEAIYQALLGMP